MNGQAESKGRRMAEAAAWRAHLAEIDAESTGAFESWLAADPANREAWERIDGVWGLFDDHPTAPELIAVRHAALKDLRHFERLRRPQWMKSAVGAVLAAALLLGGAIYWLEQPQDYATDFGERRIVTLSDNSRVTLDSGSRLRVAFSGHARELELLRGQARFEVAHDAGRPFSVHAGDRTVVATGTDFDVDMPGRDILVTLIRGHVDVRGARRTVSLEPGERLTAAPNAAPKIEHVDISEITAWQSGQLVFDNEPLSSVVARVSRYALTPVRVADPKAGALRMSGVFNTGDVVGFVETVIHYLPVEATRAETGEIWLHSKA